MKIVSFKTRKEARSRLKACFIALLAIFLVFSTSKSVSAFDVTVDVTPIGSWAVTSAFQTTNACTFHNNQNPAYANNTGSASCTTSMNLYGVGGLGFNNHYVFGITQYYYEYRDREPINEYFNGTPELTVYSSSGSAIWVADFLGYGVDSFSESSVAVTNYFRFSQAPSGVFPQNSWFHLSNYPGLQPNEIVMAPTSIALYSIPDGFDSQGIINAIEALEVTVEGSTGVTNQEMTSIINSQTQSLQQSISALQQAQEDSNDDAQDRWEQDKQEQADKQDELESQSDDLAVSAQNPGNPFASMFNSSGCQSLPTVSSWFNMSEPMQVCSPYPQNIRPIIEFVSSAIVVGLLLRVYFKQLNGGYDS